MPGVPLLRERVAAKIAALYGRRYDARHRDHHHRRRHAGHPHRRAVLRASGRRGHRARALLRQLRAQHRTRRRPRRARAAGAGQLPARLRPHRGRAHAAHAAGHRSTARTTPAPPSGHAPRCSGWRNCWRRPSALLLSDEVYEHMVFDGAPHVSAAAIPALAARAFVVSSFGKTYPVTGWKVGTVAAPAALTAEFRKVHQFNVFTVNTPMQHGLARYMADAAPYLRTAGLLPAQARPVPRRPGAHAAARAAQPGQLLPARRLQRRERAARGRVLPVADARGRGGGDPAVGVLRGRLRAGSGAAVLRQARRNAAWRRCSGCSACSRCAG